MQLLSAKVIYIKFRTCIYLLLFLIGLLYSCKKENEITFPVIVVEQPIANQVFTVLDTIVVKATVNHDKVLESVSVAVLNNEMILITPRFMMYPQGNNYTINTSIIVDDIEAPSGNYYLHIKASDGKEITNSYTRIYLHEAPRIFGGAIVITKSPAQFLNINHIDNNLQYSSVGNLSSDFGFAVYEPVEKHLYISGKFNRYLYCYNFKDSTLKWQTQVSGTPPAPFFNDMALFKKKVYVAIKNQAILAYDANGSLTSMINTATDLFPDKIFFHNDLIITSQLLLSGMNSFLVVYFQVSGATAQTLQTSLYPVAFFAKDENNIFVFANDLNGNAELRLYDSENNSIWEPYNLPIGSICKVEEIDNNNFLIAYSDRVYKYTYSYNSLTVFIDDIQVESLKYDVLNQGIWVATKDKRIVVYNYPFGLLQNQVTLNDSIKELILVYNK
ncbi:MAG: hypothetical protein PHT69_13585 [Bacteroidales bacterium]|nr:hypothetical protein [Bacteroidales bacterium]